MAKPFSLKKHNFEDRGDTLEAKLRDAMGNYYYKGRALINSPKQMRVLMDDLKKKGISFRSDWFD